MLLVLNRTRARPHVCVCVRFIRWLVGLEGDKKETAIQIAKACNLTSKHSGARECVIDVPDAASAAAAALRADSDAKGPSVRLFVSFLIVRLFRLFVCARARMCVQLRQKKQKQEWASKETKCYLDFFSLLLFLQDTTI